MSYKEQKYYFFRCTHCGQFYLTAIRIKTKKCIWCHRSFQFEQAMKFSKICSGYQARKILQELKKQDSKKKSIASAHFGHYQRFLIKE